MPKASPIQTAFNAGELSPRLEGRVDLAKYGAGCAKLQNFLPLVQGGALKRSGTRFVREVKTSTLATRLIAFEFGTTQAYILEFGNLYMRVYWNGGIVLDGAGPAVDETVTPYATADLEALQVAQSADVLYVAHPDHAPRKIERRGHDVWTITTIDFEWQPFSPENVDQNTGASASAATGTGITLTSGGGNFTSDMVGGYFKLRELIGSVHGKWESFSANTDWDSAGAIVAGDTRYWEGNVYELTDKGISDTSGTSPPIHDVGIVADERWKWEFLHPGSGYVQITAFTDAFRVTADVVKRLPASVANADVTITAATTANPVVITAAGHRYENGDRVYIQAVGGMTEINQRQFTVAGQTATTFELKDEDGTEHTAYTAGGIVVKLTHRWSDGAWSTENGYPRTVTFFEDRLWWAGSSGNPQTVWASKTGEYENHQVVDLDESALLFTLNTDQVNVIEWMSAAKLLALGTAGGEFVVSASSETEAITPGNVRAVRHATYGSKSEVQPVRVEQVALFVQRAGRKLREFVFDFDTDSFVAPDMTVLADHIALARIKKMAFQQEPNRILWCVLEDGQLVGFTYERRQEVTGWHRHLIGGVSSFVESVAVIPHPDGDRDQVWLIVRRTVDGATKRYVEYFEEDWLRTNDAEDAFFVDSGLTYDGAPATVISGLTHLEGETVKILADGATHPDKTVASGSITLDDSASVVQVGLSYEAVLQTMRIEAGAADGVAQGKTKRITRTVFRLDQTGPGLFYGPTDVDADMDELNMRDGSDLMDSPVPLFDGDTERLLWPEGYEQLGRVTVKHKLPLPCTVTAIMLQLSTQDA